MTKPQPTPTPASDASAASESQKSSTNRDQARATSPGQGQEVRSNSRSDGPRQQAQGQPSPNQGNGQSQNGGQGAKNRPSDQKPNAASQKAQTPPGSNPQSTLPPPAPVARRARWKARHWMLVISFLAMVILPICVSAYYLWARAADQYISRVGFSVRTEDASSAMDILGGLTSMSGSSSSDTDILYQFLSSQELVERVDEELDLRSIWSRVDASQDPIYAYRAPGSIEDLVAHWERQVRIHYDSGLIDLEVLAFDPQDARNIAQLIFEESSAMINQLSAIAREDAISYARDDLQQSEQRLSEARIAIARWRNENQTVDPTADTAGQMGLVNNLQGQLAEALIELDILRDTTNRDDDPRISQAERRISVIRDRIAAERAVIGTAGDGRVAFADLVGEYERLQVDLEFAERAYTTALAAYDSARNDARRQSRYLAAHMRPTIAQRSEYPDRPMTLTIVAIFAFLIWSVVALVAYSLRDRR